jgi:hypothetical protein
MLLNCSDNVTHANNNPQPWKHNGYFQLWSECLNNMKFYLCCGGSCFIHHQLP